MKNKKPFEKANKTNQKNSEASNFTGKRRTREFSDIIINKHDIYSILDELNFDSNFKIPKKKNADQSNKDQAKIESNKNEELNKIIKMEKQTDLYGGSDTGSGLSKVQNEEIIKREESPYKVEFESNNQDNSKSSNSNKSLLRLILSDYQLCEFSEIFQNFSKEIESPFTLDYFMKLKENLYDENKDKIINTLLFLVWSLKFMKIDKNYSKVGNTKMDNVISFSIPSANLPVCSQYSSSDKRLTNYISHPNSEKCKYHQMALNRNEIGNTNMVSTFYPSDVFNVINKNTQADLVCATNVEHSMNYLNMYPYQRINNNCIIPFNIVPAISLINTPAYTMTNSNVNNNQIQNQVITTILPQENTKKEDPLKTIKNPLEMISESVQNSSNILSPISNNQGLNNQTFFNKSNNNITLNSSILSLVNNFSEKPVKDPDSKDFNITKIKKEDSYIDITFGDDKMKEESSDNVYNQIMNIFSNPICDETFKQLKIYLQDDHVDKIENFIRKNPLSSLNKKQYILLCKREKDGLYLKMDPTTKKFSISRTFSKSN